MTDPQKQLEKLSPKAEIFKCIEETISRPLTDNEKIILNKLLEEYRTK